MEKQLYDIEVYINYFCAGLENYVTKEKLFFEISEQQNDIHKIYNYFNNFNGFLISFNGVHYDNVVIKYILFNYNNLKNMSYKDICKKLKELSDIIIEDDFNNDLLKKLKYFNVKWTDIDLFLYWSKMLRISKKISLKSLGIQLGYPVVQELPYKPSSVLTINDIPKLREYNQLHDLGILRLLTQNMEDEIKLRGNILNDYNLECWSWDAPKIASEALLADYCRITGKNVNDVRKQRFEKPKLYLNECLKGFEPEFKLPIFQKLWTDILNSEDSFSKEIIVLENNTSIKLTYGIGGLHSVNNNEEYVSNTDFQVITSDVASLYPNLMINYGCLRFPEVLDRYKQVKFERIEAKHAKNKPKDSFLKLILNSTSGLIDNQHSWLYYPEGAMRLRLIGQLILTKFIEVCIINKWQVVSANTDGIEVIVPRHQLQQYENILNMTCKKFNLDLEHEYYNKIVYANVNNYIAVTKDGKYKQKGMFVPKPVLGNSVDELVIAKALEAYYTQNISPREFISNPDKYGLHIYDYCKSNKIGKDFVVYWNNQIQQQLNRYYFSKKGAYLFKQKHGQGTMQHVNVDNPVILYNVHQEKSWNDYNINYNYYIAATQKIIDEIANFHQLKLF